MAMWRSPCVVVAAAIAFAITRADGFVAAQEMRSPAVRSALGKILTEDHVSQSAYSVCERAMRLPDAERFTVLAAYVLPSEDHDSLRLEFDLTPTCPAPVVQPVVGSPVIDGVTQAASGPPRFSGSEFASPALELIRVAARLGRLPEIRQRVEIWQPIEVEDRKCLAAMRSAMACAQRNFPDAQTHLQSLIQLAREQPGDRLERTPEAFGLWTAAEHPEMQPLVEEFWAILYEDIRQDQYHRNVRSERWKRWVHAKRPSLLPPANSKTLADTQRPMWIPVSRMTSETRGSGFPQPQWQCQPGKAFHAVCHDHDSLYYRSPLSGKFTVEADATAFAFRDIHLGFGSYWAGPYWDLNFMVQGGFRGDQRGLPIRPPLTRMFDTMRVRMECTDDKALLYINGRLADTQQLKTPGDPWLSIHSWWYTNGTVSNLRITGEPVIPDTVSLLAPSLDGWVGYYDETVGGQNANWLSRPGVKTTLYSGLFGTKSPPNSGDRELYSRRRQDLSQTFSELLLRYHRPMIEDGTIEYEFFYEPGITHVHPVLDRMCLILNPEGVDIHWATDGRHDRTGVGPDNITSEPQHRKSKGLLPLKPAEWNRVALSMVGDTVNLSLNGEAIYARPLEATNLRTFGLFHWSDQTEVRVREMTWRGDWPKTLPPLSEQSLADLSLDTALGDRMALKSVLAHDFRNGVPANLMSVTGDNWQSQVKQLAEGIQITRPGGEYVNYALISPISLNGDFDIILEYDQLKIQAEAGGEGNIELLALLDDERAREHHLQRKMFVFANRQEQVTQAAVSEKRGNETQYSFFEAPPEESVSGRLRLVRRGTTLYSLIAERDSRNYRLIHRETVTQDEAKFQLRVGHHKGGATSVLWKSLDVRAEDSFGAFAGPLKSITELDTERSQLPEHRMWDFRVQKPGGASNALGEFDIAGGTVAKLLPELEGLRVDVPGSDGWSASGLCSRHRIEGDFDIALELDVLHMEPCLQYNESCVFLQTEFRDKRQTSIETKFAIHHASDRKAETQLRRVRRDKTFDYQKQVSQPSDDATLLRLARRGDVIYQIFQNSTQKIPVVLGALQIGREPVLPGDLRMLIHTGGDKRMTSVRFRTLSVWAEKLIEPKLPSGKPNP